MQKRRREEPSLAFGGQALIEGVMIRTRKHLVMSIRQSDNDILTHVEEIKSLTTQNRILGLPFIRGLIALFETFYLGVKGLYFSANAILDEEERFTYKEFALVVVLAMGITSFFFIVPFLLTTLLNLIGVLFNIIEAAIRLSLFLLYITLVSFWGEFKRILQYHGAEHKTINAFEANAALDTTNVKMFSRLHPRCGTSFIFVVIIVSIFLFSVITDSRFWIRLAYRMLLIPIIGAISYELLRLSDKYRNSFILKILTMPGLTFQRLTTREPDDDMISVAINAVEEVLKLRDFKS